MQNNSNNAGTIDLLELGRILLQKIVVIILSGVIFALAAIIVTQLSITPQYKSETKMYVMSQNDTSQLTSSDMQISTLLVQDYAEILSSRTVAEAVVAELKLDLTPEQVINKMTVTTSTNARVITISVQDSDPYRAKEIADAFREKGAAHIEEVINSVDVSVIDVANIPQSPVSPSRMKNAMTAGMLGIVLACGIILVQYMLNDTIRTAEDVERYLELSTLGMIPIEKSQQQKTKKKKKAQQGKRR